MKLIIFILSIFIFHSISIGQTVHFSQFSNAALMTNPANTGNFDGEWRVNNISRSQGINVGEPYTTNLIAFDKHFYYYQQQISGGAYLVNDFSAHNSLMVNKFYLSGGYQLKISGNMLLLYGLQAGIVQKRSTLNGLTFPNQFDMSIGQFNASLVNNESLTGDNVFYADIATGLSFQYNKPRYQFEVGGSIYQINQPQESFYGIEQNLPRKYVLHGLWKQNFKNNFYYNPQLYCAWINHVSEVVFGSHFGYTFRENKKLSTVYIGVYVRNGFAQNYDSGIFVFGMTYNHWNFSISYDYDISGLRVATSRSNAVELAISYTRPLSLLKKTTIPCERY